MILKIVKKQLSKDKECRLCIETPDDLYQTEKYFKPQDIEALGYLKFTAVNMIATRPFFEKLKYFNHAIINGGAGKQYSMSMWDEFMEISHL